MCFWASSSVTQPAWAQTWICEDVIMILRLEKKKKKQYLRDDKWVKSLLISSVSHPQWKVDRIKSYQLSACRSHSRQRAPGDWQLKGLDHETNAGKAATVLIVEETSHTPMHTAQRRWHVHLVYWWDWAACMWTCFSICMLVRACVCVCVWASHPVSVVFMSSASWVQFFIRRHYSFSPCLLIFSSQLLDPVNTATHTHTHTEEEKQKYKKLRLDFELKPDPTIQAAEICTGSSQFPRHCCQK